MGAVEGNWVVEEFKTDMAFVFGLEFFDLPLLLELHLPDLLEELLVLDFDIGEDLRVGLLRALLLLNRALLRLLSALLVRLGAILTLRFPLVLGFEAAPTLFRELRREVLFLVHEAD